MDLWLGWALVVALLVSAVVATVAVRRGARRLPLVSWVLTVAGASTLAFLTYDDLTVSDGELDDAVATVATRLDGATYVVPTLELRRQIGEELGHPVDLVTTADAEPDTAERQQTDYTVTPRAGDDDDRAACLVVVVTSDGEGQTMAVSAEPDRCAA